MPNVVKYQSGGSETHSIKKGNLWFGVGGRGYGPTDTTGFYSGIEIPDGGYAFYQGSAGGFTYYTANNDDQLVALVNSATGNSFDISESLHYIAQQDGMAVMKKNENQTVTDGLVFNVDASSLLSYPTTESVWYDLSGNNNSGSLINGGEFNSNGAIELDGIDDYIEQQYFTSTDFADNQSWTIDTLVNVVSNITAGNTRGGILTNQRYLSEPDPGGFGLNIYNEDYVINLTSGSTGNADSYQNLATTDINYNTIERITAIWDEETTTAKIYRNGELENSSTNSSYSWSARSSGLPQKIGTSTQGGWNYYFNMKLYDVSLYNKALSESEIFQNYYGGPIVTDDLAFYFDPGNLVSYESGSTTAYSMTGSYTGTLINDVELDPQKGGVWKFDAVDTAISYGYQVINFNPSTQPFSMGGWMRLDSDSGSGNHAVIIDIGGTSSARLYIAIDKNDLRLVVNIRPPAGTTSVPVYTPENSVSFGEWVHGMVTFNGGTIKIYQNGELSRTATGFTNYPTATYNWWSGHQDDNNHYMDGFIGPVSLYLKTLSDDEVWQNYLAQSIRFK